MSASKSSRGVPKRLRHVPSECFINDFPRVKQTTVRTPASASSSRNKTASDHVQNLQRGSSSRSIQSTNTRVAHLAISDDHFQLREAQYGHNAYGSFASSQPSADMVISIPSVPIQTQTYGSTSLPHSNLSSAEAVACVDDERSQEGKFVSAPADHKADQRECQSNHSRLKASTFAAVHFDQFSSRLDTMSHIAPFVILPIHGFLCVILVTCISSICIAHLFG
ncbi:hypothetical protein BDN70DRAFT_918636 [Pholiota conissans]|uniref:Uncharacterized protein n=1 Tax=Pholiota conissans TaxID=109636 RepID=A0A9P5Z814_9AGAR|nr:hypothetical protein BDN70DRAFT_918636 [Pholiota conissans]